MVGGSGGETGIRGFVAAYDPDTGKEQWRSYTIPAPGEPGSETWPKGGDQWKHAGAPLWVTGNYDPDTNTAYWGTGNGGPWMCHTRPGENLYTSSTLAIDVATGAIKGYFQYTPNESLDRDEPSPPSLVDYLRNGRTVNGLIDVARNGYLWFLDRSNGGAIKFVEGKPYVNQMCFAVSILSLDRSDVDPAHKPRTNKRAEFCPGSHGGKNWPRIPPGRSRERKRLVAQLWAKKRSPKLRSGVTRVYCWAALPYSRRPPITLARCKPGTSKQVKKYGRISLRNRRIGE
jgi:alcohol dehydrogenase (cytochrome c)